MYIHDDYNLRLFDHPREHIKKSRITDELLTLLHKNVEPTEEALDEMDEMEPDEDDDEFYLRYPKAILVSILEETMGLVAGTVRGVPELNTSFESA